MQKEVRFSDLPNNDWNGSFYKSLKIKTKGYEMKQIMKLSQKTISLNALTIAVMNYVNNATTTSFDVGNPLIVTGKQIGRAHV